MGAGHSHTEGDYQPTVAKGLEFLMRGQTADGHLASQTSLYARMYCHSMASFALAEALAMTGDRRLEPAVRRAVDYSLRAQNPSTGGWRYRPGDQGDTSQLGWQLMSLWSAERAGIQIPQQTWTGAERFLRSVRRGQVGRAGELPAGRPGKHADDRRSAVLPANRRRRAGRRIGSPGGGRSYRGNCGRAARTSARESVLLVLWDTLRCITSSSWQVRKAEAAWQTWNTALTLALVNSQLAEGPDTGSWEPNCIWGGYGGRVYSTAIATMCLEVYYRYTSSTTDRGLDRVARRSSPSAAIVDAAGRLMRT